MSESLQAQLVAAGLGRFIVRRASPGQYNASVKIHAEGWSYHLDLEQYQDRGRLINESELGRGMHCWILVPEDDPDGLDIRCTAEIWSTPVLYAAPSSDQVVTRPAYGLFSLFVPLPHRNCGYAHLFNLLMYERLGGAEDIKWSKETMPELSTLLFYGFSDIGEEFYCSYATVVSPYHVLWPVASSSPAPAPRARPLREIDFRRIASKDIALVSEELPRRARLTGAHCFALRPRAATYEVRAQLCRYNYITRGRPPPAPEIFGAELEGEGSEWGFAIWVLDWKYKVLQILRLRASTRSQLLSLLSVAAQEGQKWGMDRISAWNVDTSLLDGERLERFDNALPELHWLAGQGKVQWCINEAFGDTHRNA